MSSSLLLLFCPRLQFVCPVFLFPSGFQQTVALVIKTKSVPCSYILVSFIFVSYDRQCSSSRSDSSDLWSSCSPSKCVGPPPIWHSRVDQICFKLPQSSLCRTFCEKLPHFATAPPRRIAFVSRSGMLTLILTTDRLYALLNKETQFFMPALDAFTET